MPDPLVLAAQRKVDRFEKAGLDDQAKRARKRLKEIEEAAAVAEDGVSMSNTKAELLAAADVAGVEADESMTKAEILEALEA